VTVRLLLRRSFMANKTIICESKNWANMGGTVPTLDEEAADIDTQFAAKTTGLSGVQIVGYSVVPENKLRNHRIHYFQITYT
jgi:hypothetical protein